MRLRSRVNHEKIGRVGVPPAGGARCAPYDNLFKALINI